MNLIYFSFIIFGLNFFYFQPKYEAEIDIYYQNNIIIGYKVCWDKLVYPLYPKDLNWTHYVYTQIPINNNILIYSSFGIDIYNNIDTEIFLIYNYRNFNFEIGYSIFDKMTFIISYIIKF